VPLSKRATWSLGLSGKQFEILGLATVLTALFYYQPADILGAAHRLPAGSQETLLRIDARPIAKPGATAQQKPTLHMPA
jgi:hypothetical protein